jgi:hypothetical protein
VILASKRIFMALQGIFTTRIIWNSWAKPELFQ